MSLVVQKYGGTSVGSLDRIRMVAERIAETYREGHQVMSASRRPIAKAIRSSSW